MESKALAFRVESWQRRRDQHSKTIIKEMARHVASSNDLTDDEIRTLDATLDAAGMAWDKFAEQVAIINKYAQLQSRLNQATDPTPNYDAAKCELNQILALGDDLKAADKAAQERFRDRRAAAMKLVEEAKQAVRSLDLLKQNVARLRRDHADLLGVS